LFRCVQKPGETFAKMQKNKDNAGIIKINNVRFS
jgi:hypothetical protein